MQQEKRKTFKVLIVPEPMQHFDLTHNYSSLGDSHTLMQLVVPLAKDGLR